MKKILSLFCVLGGLAVPSEAQQFNEIHFDGTGRCAFNEVLQRVHYPYADAMKAYEKTIAETKALQAAAKTTGTIYRIPVVFHVVYSAATPQFNLPDSILLNQIAVLNKSFRKTHGDTGKTRPIFKPLSKDAEIEFYLATKDPQGNPTNGITRTVSTRNYFGSAFGDLDSMERIKSTATGGIDPWPSTKYLNIWIGNLTDAQGNLSVLGYAIPPLNPLPPNWPAGSEIGLAGLIDGVVMQPHGVGDNNPLSAALQGTYTKGRSTVHEVGHYLGLMHTFGATDGSNTGNCGTPLVSDGIGDTPEQSLISVVSGGNCASSTKNSCGSGTGDLPDMWENYMDYTTDACQTMFTNDQVLIMRNVMTTQRNTLHTPTTSVGTVSLTQVAIYPNPATDHIMIQTDEVITKVTVFNFVGQVIATYTGANAAGNGYPVSTLAPGNYLLKAETTSGALLTGKFVITQ